MKMVYHSDEIPLDIGFSLTGLLPMHCIETSIQSKLSFSSYKATFPISKNRAYFRVMYIALNDVNVRGGNEIKPFAREIGTSQNFVSL